MQRCGCQPVEASATFYFMTSYRSTHLLPVFTSPTIAARTASSGDSIGGIANRATKSSVESC